MIDLSQTDLSTAPMVLASRKSKLAMAQTEEVRRSILPVPAEILGLSTTGDEVLDRPLVDVGGKGVFIKTLETALLDGRADAAVHSLKDMETHIALGTEKRLFYLVRTGEMRSLDHIVQLMSCRQVHV